MILKRRKIATAMAVAAGGIVVLVTQIGASGSDVGALKLEGAWVARVASINGQPFPAISQWSYVYSPAAAGRSAAVHGTIDLTFGPGDPWSTPFIGEAVQTGPDTAAFNVYWHIISPGAPGQLNQLIGIGAVSGVARYVAPGKAEFTHYFKIYPASADADGDGFPDEGSTPSDSFTVTTLDTRMPSPAQ